MAPNAIVATGHNDEDGRVCFDDWPAFRQQMEARGPGDWICTVTTPKRKGSDRQRKWWFGIAVAMIADELGYERDERELVHNALLCKFFGSVTVRNPFGGADVEVPKVRFSKTTVEQRRELMEWVVRYAAKELNCVLPLPADPICDAMLAQDEAA